MKIKFRRIKQGKKTTKKPNRNKEFVKLNPNNIMTIFFKDPLPLKISGVLD